MKTFGESYSHTCPICGFIGDIPTVWKIPFSPIKKGHVQGVALRQAPLLNSTIVYNYGQCPQCNTVFLNPVTKAYWDNRTVSHHAEKAEKRSDWHNYERRVRFLLNVPITEYNTVIDIAAGGSQCLTIMKEMDLPWKRLIATDIQEPSVEYAKKLGYEAYRHDICQDKLICENEANYVIFAEAFEHVQSPLIALQNISKMLAPDGYVFFTATATEGNLPIRPGENIMTNEKALVMLLSKCNLHIVRQHFGADRWLIVAQK